MNGMLINNIIIALLVIMSLIKIIISIKEGNKSTGIMKARQVLLGRHPMNQISKIEEELHHMKWNINIKRVPGGSTTKNKEEVEVESRLDRMKDIQENLLEVET